MNTYVYVYIWAWLSVYLFVLVCECVFVCVCVCLRRCSCDVISLIFYGRIFVFPDTILREITDGMVNIYKVEVLEIARNLNPRLSTSMPY